jgi:hypothetical protein
MPDSHLVSAKRVLLLLYRIILELWKNSVKQYITTIPECVCARACAVYAHACACACVHAVLRIELRGLCLLASDLPLEPCLQPWAISFYSHFQCVPKSNHISLQTLCAHGKTVLCTKQNTSVPKTERWVLLVNYLKMFTWQCLFRLPWSNWWNPAMRWKSW